VFSHKLSLNQATLLFCYHLPRVLQQTIPLAVLLGTIILFQRLSQYYELVAMMASGVSLQRILRAVLWVGLLFSGLHYLVNESLIPYAQPRLEALYREAGLNDIPDKNFLFVEKQHGKTLSKLFLIGQTEQSALKDFIVLYFQETPMQGVQISRILRSETGRWVPENRQWLLQHGVEYVLNHEGVYKDIRIFDQQSVHTSRYAASLLDYSRKSPVSMPFQQLKQYIKMLKAGGQNQSVPFFEVHLWQHLSGPVSTVVFALLGAILGLERLRTNRMFGLTFGALVIFTYSIMVPFSNHFGALALLPSAVVAWVPLVLSMVLTGLLQVLRPKHG
jgi:lipopolysaccharide export system permease protein